MPNWAYQEIHCKNKEDLQKLRKAFSTDPNDDDADIDFNKIIPMPKSIELTKSPSNFNAVTFFLMPEKILPLEEVNLKIDEFAKTLENPIHKRLPNKIVKKLIKFKVDSEGEMFKKDITDGLINPLASNEFLEYCRKFNLKPTFENYGKQMLYNFMMYGAHNWYNWSILYWDTKWNASYTIWTDTSVYFQTAWGPAINPIVKASEILQIPLFVEWAEEQFTEYGGCVEIENGQIINNEIYDKDPEKLFITSARLIDPDQENFRFDEKRHEIVSEWGFENYDIKNDYEVFEDIPEIELKNLDLEDFLEKYK